MPMNLTNQQVNQLIADAKTVQVAIDSDEPGPIRRALEVFQQNWNALLDKATPDEMAELTKALVHSGINSFIYAFRGNHHKLSMLDLLNGIENESVLAQKKATPHLQLMNAVVKAAERLLNDIKRRYPKPTLNEIQKCFEKTIESIDKFVRHNEDMPIQTRTRLKELLEEISFITYGSPKQRQESQHMHEQRDHIVTLLNTAMMKLAVFDRRKNSREPEGVPSYANQSGYSYDADANGSNAPAVHVGQYQPLTAVKAPTAQYALILRSELEAKAAAAAQTVDPNDNDAPAVPAGQYQSVAAAAKPTQQYAAFLTRAEAAAAAKARAVVTPYGSMPPAPAGHAAAKASVVNASAPKTTSHVPVDPTIQALSDSTRELEELNARTSAPKKAGLANSNAATSTAEPRAKSTVAERAKQIQKQLDEAQNASTHSATSTTKPVIDTKK